MKTSLYLAMFSLLSFKAVAYEVEFAEMGLYVKPDYENIDSYIAQNEKDIKILNLTHLLERQEKMYHDKIIYLERELKKSNERVVELSLNVDRHVELAQKKSQEEITFLKKDVIAKTKTIMEYQRQLEKIQPGKDMQEKIQQDTLLAVEMRKSTDQIAINNLLKMRESLPQKIDGEAKRMPASVDK